MISFCDTSYSVISFHNRCLEYLCRYGSSAGMDTRDNTYKTPLLVAVEAQLPGHLKRLLMAKVHSQLQFIVCRFKRECKSCNPSPCDGGILGIVLQGQRLP